MKITLGPTGEIEPITEVLGQVWVGRTSGGIEIVAVIAVVGCKPEDHEAFVRELAVGGTSLQFGLASTAQRPGALMVTAD